MICPKCKNEKWEADVCPQCGLSEKEAYLFKAESLHKEENWNQAVEAYDKYLYSEPNDFDVKCKKAYCLCSEAIYERNERLFGKAGEYLDSLLNDQWNWEMGHQFQVELFFHFDKLNVLLNKYEIATLDETRRIFALKTIKIIKLTEEFKKATHSIFRESKESDERKIWLKSFWPLLLGFPPLFFAAFHLFQKTNAKDSSQALFLFLVFIILGILVVMLFFISMKLYGRNQKSKDKAEKIGKPNYSSTKK